MSVSTVVRIQQILIHHGMADAVAAFRFVLPLSHPCEFVALILNKTARPR